MPIVADMRKQEANGHLRKAIGPAIREIRQRTGISVSQLAVSVGCTQGYMSNVELGHKQPTVEFLARVARQLGCSLDAISYVPETVVAA